MTVKLLLLVRADGNTRQLDPKKIPWPGRWLVVENVPYQRGDIAWRLEEGEDEPHGTMVFVEVEPRRYASERARILGHYESAARDLAEMPLLDAVPACRHELGHLGTVGEITWCADCGAERRIV